MLLPEPEGQSDLSELTVGEGRLEIVAEKQAAEALARRREAMMKPGLSLVQVDMWNPYGHWGLHACVGHVL